GFDRDAAFVDIVAARFLDVDILARLAGPNGHQGVPVVGRGDGDGVEGFILQCLADVLDHLRVLAARASDLLESPTIGACVGVDEVGDLHAFHARARPLFDVFATPAVQTGDADVDGVVGTEDAAGGFRSRDRNGGGGGQSAFQKRATSWR